MANILNENVDTFYRARVEVNFKDSDREQVVYYIGPYEKQGTAVGAGKTSVKHRFGRLGIKSVNVTAEELTGEWNVL